MTVHCGLERVRSPISLAAFASAISPVIDAAQPVAFRARQLHRFHHRRRRCPARIDPVARRESDRGGGRHAAHYLKRRRPQFRTVAFGACKQRAMKNGPHDSAGRVHARGGMAETTMNPSSLAPAIRPASAAFEDRWCSRRHASRAMPADVQGA